MMDVHNLPGGEIFFFLNICHPVMKVKYFYRKLRLKNTIHCSLFDRICDCIKLMDVHAHPQTNTIEYENVQLHCSLAIITMTVQSTSPVSYFIISSSMCSIHQQTSCLRSLSHVKLH